MGKLYKAIEHMHEELEGAHEYAEAGPSPLLFIFLDAVIIDFKIVNIV